MIVATVVYCMTLNPTMCRELRMVPDDYHAITSISECLKGGVIGSMTFKLDDIEWRTKGVRCIEVETPETVVQLWMKQKGY